ncbi:MAG: methylmalonyl-CoA epimerase [Candidatus Marinimicrobia bacterium]|nr:methylmalonyl-CoA epimerase [Candidatus Neomarinimicrobiota bacterium]|tara:strand:+ start:861 stop:1271 length:411 start_codon:yes stop_codon:yes gene_type:complete
MNFKILGIEHVAIAVSSLKEPSKVFGDILGIDNTSTEEIVDQKVVTDIFDTGRGKVELLEATSEHSPISNFIEKRGNGLHHIAFLVDDLEIALKDLAESGIDLIDNSPRIGAEGMLIAFLHPKSTCGVLVELCQKP